MAAENDAERPGVRTFLIADIRGYTRFTQERGDEAAAQLASAFAQLARSTVADFDVSLIELRGDEALAVFSSSRQALRAAVELQRRSREPVGDGPPLPLGLGVGLDSGEAVPTSSRPASATTAQPAVRRPARPTLGQVALLAAGRPPCRRVGRRADLRVFSTARR